MEENKNQLCPRWLVVGLKQSIGPFEVLTSLLSKSSTINQFPPKLKQTSTPISLAQEQCVMALFSLLLVTNQPEAQKQHRPPTESNLCLSSSLLLLLVLHIHYKNKGRHVKRLCSSFLHSHPLPKHLKPQLSHITSHEN